MMRKKYPDTGEGLKRKTEEKVPSEREVRRRQNQLLLLIAEENDRKREEKRGEEKTKEAAKRVAALESVQRQLKNIGAAVSESPVRYSDTGEVGGKRKYPDTGE